MVKGYMDYNGISVMRNATGCGNSREEGEEKKAGDTSKAEDRKNGEVRNGIWEKV